MPPENLADETLEAKFGLPAKVAFCKVCVISNQRPNSAVEYQHTKDSKKSTIGFDAEGVCDACRFAEKKRRTIDWNERERELKELLDKHRSKDGSYDCLLPGSGGKDSVYASHLLKYKYGMHPLTVTWSPHLYTDIGWENFQNWIHVGGFDNFLFTPDGKIHRLLTRNAFLNLLHPFQPFIFGQKTFAAKMAARFGIPLIFYGENPGEYGANISFDKNKFGFGEGAKPGEREGHRLDFLSGEINPDEVYLGGKSLADYYREGRAPGDFAAYLPLDPAVIEKNRIEVHFLGYYIKWVSQEAYYYAVENADFKANPVRSEGTYSKYSSLDDKIDGFFYYTTYVKFGYGRATMDASQEVRNKHITREEAAALVKKFDGEFPARHFKDVLAYLGLNEEEFRRVCDSFRSEKIWRQGAKGWELRHKVWDENVA